MAKDEVRKRWETRAGAVLIWIAGVIFAVAASFAIRGEVPNAWRLAGGILQLLGIGIGVLVRAWKWFETTDARWPAEWLRDARRAFTRRLRPVRRWMRSKLGRESEVKDQTVGVGTATVEATALPVGISRSPAEDPDLEQRVERLEKQVSRLRRRIGEVQQAAHQRADTLEERLRSVRKGYREADRDLEERLAEQIRGVAVGSLRWEYVALGWFVVGVLATTWAGDLPAPPVPG